MARPNDLVVLKPEGLYCPAGDFYIDPWRPVEHAVITHGHSDHARRGMARYYSTRSGLPILQWRLGQQDYCDYAYGERFELGDARVSFHSAGHVLGSAQVRIEVANDVWVVSGDYKRQADPSCEPFESVPCDAFITEATFALPIYQWPDTPSEVRKIILWQQRCQAVGKSALLYAYGLGKAQRVLAEWALLQPELAPELPQTVYLHTAAWPGVQVYAHAGCNFPNVATLAHAKPAAGSLIIAPPGAAIAKAAGEVSTGFASGWMQLRGPRRRDNYECGFVISDHADWNDLLRTIEQSGAQRVIATHGNTDALIRYLRESGLDASSFKTEFSGD